MSLFDAMYTAITGLNSQQIDIGNISQNVANAQTVGYKGLNTSFQSLVFGNGQFDEPGDVAAVTTSTNDVSGSLVQSQQATSLAINGQGFFVVKAPPASTTNGTSTFNAQDLYTRAGDFAVNANGYLVNSAGYYLEGYPVDAATGALAGTTTQPIQIPRTDSTPVATSTASLLANLPSSAAISGTPGYTAPSPVTEQIYDAQGNSHTVTIQFNKTAANTWDATISAAGSAKPQADPVTLKLTFGDGVTKAPDGTVPAAGTLASITDISATKNGTPPTISADTAGGAASVGLTFDFGNGNQTVSLGLGTYGGTTGLTQFAGTSVDVSSQTQNGSAPGTLTGLTIDQNGFVNLSYTNGQTTKAFQVAVAQFNAPDQLDRVTGTAYAATSDSGNANVSVAGADGAGTISPSTLEQSNVDIASELTNLITAQQVYSSNARVITTANQMVQTLNQIFGG